MTDTPRPGFAEIKTEVLRRIQQGIWPPGSLLPTEVELTREFGCARATVNRALRELAEQGVIDRKRKSGTRVNVLPAKFARFEISLVRQTIEEANATYRYALVEKSVGAAPGWLRAQASLPQDQQVMHLRCMHYADDQPYQFEERWINVAAVPDILDADLETVGPNEWLLREVPFTDAQINLSAVAADRDLSEFLATSEGTPLFRLERTTWLDGTFVTFVRMTHRPGHTMTTQY